MVNLQAKHRDTGVKAKQLRRNGLIPASLYGSDIENSVLFQAAEADVKKLLRLKTAGGQVMLELDGEKINTQLKEIARNPVSGQVEHLSFQKLNKDDLITGSAQVVLLNREKIPGFIQQILFEIPYRAKAVNLIEKIEIDLEGMAFGASVKVSELDIANNEDIEVLTDLDGLVVSIIDNRKMAAEAEAEELEAEAEEEASEDGA